MLATKGLNRMHLTVPEIMTLLSLRKCSPDDMANGDLKSWNFNLSVTGNQNLEHLQEKWKFIHRSEDFAAQFPTPTSCVPKPDEPPSLAFAHEAGKE